MKELDFEEVSSWEKNYKVKKKMQCY
jgi:hypothetical protein